MHSIEVPYFAKISILNLSGLSFISDPSLAESENKEDDVISFKLLWSLSLLIIFKHGR